MIESSQIACVIIGYNDIPFERYIDLLSRYGQHSEAYRDLQFSFVDVEGQPMDYVSLLNYVINRAAPNHNGQKSRGPLRSGEMPNLAAVYLTNYLRLQGISAAYINLFQHEKNELAQILKEDNPLCVAITTTFYILNSPVAEIIQFIREHNCNTKIIVGGPLIANHVRNAHMSDLSSALADMDADFYVVDSQGESTLATLIRTLETHGDPSGVPNLIYFKGKEMIRTPVVPEANSMDTVDIRWDALAREKPLGPTLQMRTARSCAFKCAFCNYPNRAGPLSLASLTTIERELSSMRSIGNVRNVVFIDDTFNVPLPRFKSICRLMIERHYNFNWFSYFRCSNSDEESFDLMAEAGCKGVFLGIESGSPSVLFNMNKAATIDRYVSGIEQLRKRGITTFGSFILGFPGETDNTVKETANFIRSTRLDFYRAQLWYCEPGTPVDCEREKHDIRGQGFVWEHATMSSLEAMDHIDKLFLTINESVWLPQWSFDFWFIPYALGKGISIEQFKQLVASADKVLAGEIACCDLDEKRRRQRRYVDRMVEDVRNWHLNISSDE